MKKYHKFVLILIIMLLSFGIPRNVTTLSNTILGKTFLLVCVIMVIKKFGLLSGSLATIIMLMLTTGLMEGMEDGSGVVKKCVSKCLDDTGDYDAREAGASDDDADDDDASEAGASEADDDASEAEGGPGSDGKEGFISLPNIFKYTTSDLRLMNGQQNMQSNRNTINSSK
jgi:hypothetical protein